MKTCHAQFLLLATLLLLAASCNLTRQLNNSETLYQQGQYDAAAKVLHYPSSPSKALLPNLYAASANLMAENYASCLKNLYAAEEGINAQDNSLNWGGNYLARNYDDLMLYTYQGLVQLLLGNRDYARVVFNRLEERQGEAARRNQKAIAKAQKEIQQERDNPKNLKSATYLDKANQDAQNRETIQKYQHLLDEWGAYADFESPIGRFLSGIFRLFCMEDQSDAEKAVFQLKRAYGMTNSSVAQALYELAEQKADGRLPSETFQNLVVVIFENGLGPYKEEVRYDIFIPFHRPLYVGIALPRLERRPAAYPFLELRNGTAPLGKTSHLCSIDTLVATEFRKEMPWLVAKAITGAVLKTTLQVIAMEATSNNYGGNAAFFVGLLGAGIAAATTNADVRGWNLLPKEYQVALLTRPASGLLGIAQPGAAAPFIQVQLPPGPALVYVKIPIAGLPALVATIPPP